MKMLEFCRRILMNLVLWSFLPAIATAQPAKMPFSREPYFVDSGLHDGQIGPSSEGYLAFSEVVQVPGAPWLRLLFQAYDLGREMDTLKIALDTTKEEIYREREKSHLVITSLEDGGTQRLDAVSMKQWRNTSAYFNGDALGIELFVAPEDKGIYFEIWEVMAGESADTSISLQKIVKTVDLCGGDDRVSSSDAAVGRFFYITEGDTIASCTGWIASNGAHLTAGHCWVHMEVLEFNVKASDSDGTPNFAHPDDQYSVDRENIDYHNDGPGLYGDDWAVFDCYPNSNTNLLPVQAQQDFYRVSHDSNPSTFRVTGCGEDSTPLSANRTRQTDSGSNIGEEVEGPNDAYWEYVVDTQNGNSGSPIIVEGTSLTVGIHTDPGCGNVLHQHNHGTSFENNALENKLQNFPGPNVEYVDKNHPIVLENGSVFRPYDTVNEAVTAVSSGGIVSIVKGYYNETMTINTAMTITAPVGKVTIGTSGLGKSIPETPVIAESAASDTTSSLIPTVYSLSHGYPNPFNPNITIPFGLPEPARTRLVVYDLLGREVVRLVNEHLEPGYHAVVWNGKTAAGREVPSGLYIARLVTPEYVKSIKMLLLK